MINESDIHNLVDSNLTIETRKAVDLLGDVHKATETLNSRVTCSNDLNLKGKEKSSRVVPCDPPLNASDSETGVNTSLYNLNELRRTVREAQARCPSCRPGGSLSGPDFQDELQRRRMDDARRYGRRDRTDRTLAALGMIPFLGGAIKGGKALGKLARFASKRFPKAFNGFKNAADRATTVASKISKWTTCNPTVASQKANCDQRGVWGHIMKGERGSDGLLTKGLHSPSEMFNYIDELPKAVRKKVKIETAENGVRRVKLPDEAWSRDAGKFKPRKTLFPDEWEQSGYIEDAINQVLKNNSIDDVATAPYGKYYDFITRNNRTVKVEIKIDANGFTVYPGYP